MNRLKLLFVTTFLVLFAIWLFSPEKPQGRQGFEETEEQASFATESRDESKEANAVNLAQRRPAEKSSGEASPKEDLQSKIELELSRLVIPKKTELRAEALLNPHATSKRLLGLSVQLNQLVQSVQNEKEAKRLMEWLLQCGRAQSENPQTVQVLCVRQSGLLSARFVGLASDYEYLRRQAGDQVVRHADLLAEH